MDPAARIRNILATLYEAAETAFDEIEDIAKAEAERLGEDSEQGRDWGAFGGMGFFADTGAARLSVRQAIAAARGQLVYRQLDTSRQPPDRSDGPGALDC